MATRRIKIQSIVSRVLISTLVISSMVIILSFRNNISVTPLGSTNNSIADDSSAIPILKLYQDAKYAWDKLQLRKDIYNPNQTGFYYGAEVIRNVNSTTTNNLWLLPVIYAMYKMTNDTSYLDLARNLFLNILNYCSGQVNISNTIYNTITSYDWVNDVILDSIFSPVGLFIPIAFEDPFFIYYFENLVSDTHTIFWSPIDLPYKSVDKNGVVLASDSHLTWSTSITSRINMFLWMAELTGDLKYKKWADDTIEARWVSSSTSGLLPRKIDSATGSILDSSVAHYDMAGWLCTLELAYFLNDWNNSAGTGKHSYFDLITTTAQGIADYMWTSDQRWGYKTTYNTVVPSSSIPEMNAIYVDYAMILAYEITKNEEFLTKAILDFENEFMGLDPVKPTGVLMSNSLVIHSPSTFKTQSQLTGSSNSMVARTASIIYKYTQNEVFLQKAKYHYNQLMTTHRFSKGYTDMLDSISLQPFPVYNGNPAMIYDFAVTQAILALPSSFIPSENVAIDWGYGLTTTMPDGYGTPGAFTGLSIDIEQRRIHLKSVSSDVNGSLFTYFADGSDIDSVIIDNNSPYYAFHNSTLLCEEGTHAYTITFTAPSNTNSKTTTNTLPTSVPLSSSSSIEITPTTSSSSITTTSTDQSTGFLCDIIPINLLCLVLILSIRRRR